jgi:hypothetical protein
MGDEVPQGPRFGRQQLTYQQRLHRLIDDWQEHVDNGFDVLASERIDRLRDVLNEIEQNG